MDAAGALHKEEEEVKEEVVSRDSGGSGDECSSDDDKEQPAPASNTIDGNRSAAGRSGRWWCFSTHRSPGWLAVLAGPLLGSRGVLENMRGWNAAGKLLDPSLLGSSGSTTITRLHASFASQVDNAAPTSNTPAMLIGDWLGWGGRDTPATGARARRRTVYGVTAPTKMDLQQWVGLLRSAARSSSPQPILPRSPSGKEVLGEAAAAQWRRRPGAAFEALHGRGPGLIAPLFTLQWVGGAVCHVIFNRRATSPRVTCAATRSRASSAWRPMPSSTR